MAVRKTTTTSPSRPRDSFALRLAIVRAHMGWGNRAEMAEALGFSDQGIKNWEQGRVPRNMPEVCRRIAEVTGLDYTWLMVGGPLEPEDGSGPHPVAWLSDRRRTDRRRNGAGQRPVQKPKFLPPYPVRLDIAA